MSGHPCILPSEITPEAVWYGRRDWLKAAGLGAALGMAGLPARASANAAAGSADAATAFPPFSRNDAFSVQAEPTPERDVTTYNNYYEFGTGKEDPARHAGKLRLQPWQVAVEGEVLQPRVFDIDDLLRLAPMQERVYRLRCVEAWSMVVPWIGYSLSALLKQVQPTGNARFVEFETVMQPQAMPGLRRRILNWPYRETLRLDEAMHPLTMLVFGVYGKPLPGQNGAPLRLMVPWKYGFKSAKSIVRIRLTERQPVSSWTEVAPQEYGFYANVNPDVPHPRWSQATERRIGDGLFASRVATLPFNGYADQVASLYAGLDLKANY